LGESDPGLRLMHGKTPSSTTTAMTCSLGIPSPFEATAITPSSWNGRACRETLAVSAEPRWGRYGVASPGSGGVWVQFHPSRSSPPRARSVAQFSEAPRGRFLTGWSVWLQFFLVAGTITVAASICPNTGRAGGKDRYGPHLAGPGAVGGGDLPAEMATGVSAVLWVQAPDLTVATSWEAACSTC